MTTQDTDTPPNTYENDETNTVGPYLKVSLIAKAARWRGRSGYQRMLRHLRRNGLITEVALYRVDAAELRRKIPSLWAAVWDFYSREADRIYPKNDSE